MGLTVYSALKIRANRVKCQAGGPCKDKGKFTGWIMNDVDRWDPIVNTESIYDSEEDAIAAMEALVEEVRALDFSAEEGKIKELLGEDAEPVSQIIRGAMGEENDTSNDGGRTSSG